MNVRIGGRPDFLRGGHVLDEPLYSLWALCSDLVSVSNMKKLFCSSETLPFKRLIFCNVYVGTVFWVTIKFIATNVLMEYSPNDCYIHVNKMKFYFVLEAEIYDLVPDCIDMDRQSFVCVEMLEEFLY